MSNLYSKKSWEASISDFIITIFVSWEDFATAFGVTEDWDLLSFKETPPLDVIETAFFEASTTKNDENELIELENTILNKITHHWSANNIIPQHLDIKFLIKYINTWSQEGPRNKQLFPVEPVPGLGIEYFIHKSGISFTLFPPFIIPYTELYYEEFSELPEWNLEDLTKTDIAETFYLLYYKLHGPLEIDLSDWDSFRLKDILKSSPE